MNLYLSDHRFQVGGQPYAGFPILVDSAGKIVEIALHFFVDRLLRSGSARDPKTWKAYGQHLYDYFGFLEAKNLRWDVVPSWNSGDVPALAHYVKWCDASVGNSPGYINDKLGTIKRFYSWAKEAGLINELPFRSLDITSPGRTGGRLAHADGRARRVRTADVNLREPAREVRVLTRSQVDALLRGTINPTHRAVMHLGLSAGLRAEELATFPADYVIDCSRLPKNAKSVAVRLDPKRMETKNAKARTVRISVACMDALWQYRATVREQLLQRSRTAQDVLFLTRFGVPYQADGFVQPLARVGRRLDFHLHPHMLRHTFATHTLASLEDRKRAGQLRGSPLVVVMELLGHTSITTTSRYLHFIDAIDDGYATRYQAEIDAIAAGLLKPAGSDR